MDTMETQIRFAVDPRTNSDDPEQRMAQVSGCPDEHNWWAEKMGR